MKFGRKEFNQGATLTLMPCFLESISDIKTILQSLIKGRKASNLSRLMIKETPYMLSFPQFSFYSMVAMQIMFHRGALLMLVSVFKIMKLNQKMETQKKQNYGLSLKPWNMNCTHVFSLYCSSLIL